ncbi:eCIS core domain-containing protein [Streptomyces sp. NPDC055299]
MVKDDSPFDSGGRQMGLNRDENPTSDRVRGPERSRATASSTGTAVQRMLASQSAVGNAAVVQMLRQAGHLWTQDELQHDPGGGHQPPGAQMRSSVDGGTVARALEEVQQHVHGTDCGHDGAQDNGPERQRALLAAAMRSPSQPLPSSVLAKAAPFYQNDKLSSTRVHRGTVAQRATAAMGAQAMTVGNHVFLSAGAEGNEEVIGHELSHVDKNVKGVSERGNDNGAGVHVTDPEQGSERAAGQDGAAYAAGATTAPSLSAQRQATTASHRTVQRVAGTTGERVGEGEGLLQGGRTVQRAGGRGSSSRDGGHSGRSSARPPRIPVSSLPHVHYLQLPAYGPTFGRGGGTRGHVILGPRGFLDQRSDANSQLPPAIVDARAKYTNETFIAGHLVNASFGGDGRRSANLTILTSSANGRMKSFDNSIKNALDRANSIYGHLSRLSVDITPLRLGIEVDVRPAGEGYTWDTHGPGKYISQFIHCAATVRGAGLLEDWIAAELAKDPRNPDWLYVRDQLSVMDAYVDHANAMGMIDNEPRHPIVPAQSGSRRR